MGYGIHIAPMKVTAKSTQLQIRVSPRQKAQLAGEARRAGMPLSQWVLAHLLPAEPDRFRQLVEDLAASSRPGFVLAELNEFLTGLDRPQLQAVLQAVPERLPADAYRANYLAAMLEQACALQHLAPPGWLRAVVPLSRPHFVSELNSLRLHLLRHSPPAFRNRNIFIDASLGARV
jgi:hypothetical protein